MADEWLDDSEEQVLQPLDDSPQPLWELRWHKQTTLGQLADILAPGLISLAARGLVEVRRFPRWPAPWTEGVLLTGEELAQESRRAEAWSDRTTETVLAAHITAAGRRLL
ncbi:hypothetical protein GCM10010172_72990 [Paractinoplanes ferrugineus]|uniref:Uncharacterized protein n=1 Tax=Paractinoplanes ferrugineus TaxID=113564 RepID=A0A919IYQ9_9ACTN|nr:hypothetical protein [Actinoplanes ferrugineus]GIE11546.1 hypothetical protein Afe05nite_33860 [Actinoplanes ferrugineus]